MEMHRALHDGLVAGSLSIRYRRGSCCLGQNQDRVCRHPITMPKRPPPPGLPDRDSNKRAAGAVGFQSPTYLYPREHGDQRGRDMRSSTTPTRAASTRRGVGFLAP